MSDEADLVYLVLCLLGQTDGPVGSGAVCSWLRKNGHDISEATVGRFLRQLDFQGLTERTGYQGRVLTALGQTRWAELKRERALTRSSLEFMRSLEPGDLAEVVDVLVARRGLERETARLAALRATEADIAGLEALVAEYAGDSGNQAEVDFKFHVRLAEVTGNRVLQAATRLIHSQAASATIPTKIHQRLKPLLAQQHKEIVAAIRARDPVRAESAMTDHLDGVIESIQQYGQDSKLER
jgi:GntR family L-lactate dehydrogenase operon transcriptional regulator